CVFLVSATFSDFVEPHKTKTLHVGRIDLFEGTETRLTRRETIAEPVTIRRRLRGIAQHRVVDSFGLSEQQSAQQQRQSHCRDVTHRTILAGMMDGDEDK